jgi:hypothetical protein
MQGINTLSGRSGVHTEILRMQNHLKQQKLQRQVSVKKATKELDSKQRSPRKQLMSGFKEEGTENELMLIFDRLIRLQRSREDVLGLRLGEELWCSLFLTSSHAPLRSPL